MENYILIGFNNEIEKIAATKEMKLWSRLVNLTPKKVTQLPKSDLARSGYSKMKKIVKSRNQGIDRLELRRRLLANR